MVKLSFFDVDEKEQAILSRKFVGKKTFKLNFSPKSLDIRTTCVLDSDGDALKVGLKGFPEVIKPNVH